MMTMMMMMMMMMMILDYKVTVYCMENTHTLFCFPIIPVLASFLSNNSNTRMWPFLAVTCKVVFSPLKRSKVRGLIGWMSQIQA